MQRPEAYRPIQAGVFAVPAGNHPDVSQFLTFFHHEDAKAQRRAFFLVMLSFAPLRLCGEIQEDAKQNVSY